MNLCLAPTQYIGLGCYVSALNTGCNQSVSCQMFTRRSFLQLSSSPKLKKKLLKSVLIRRDANSDVHVTLERILILALIGCLPT
jgi:hypothetical protein